MGGAASVGGNASPAGEANILNDPEAADIVFGAECPIVMAGLDVTEQTLMTNDDLRRIANIDSPLARHLSAIVPYYADFYAKRLGIDGIHAHDSSAISYQGLGRDEQWAGIARDAMASSASTTARCPGIPVVTGRTGDAVIAG